MKLGHDLYQWRKANKVSQAKIADMLGVDVMTVSRWEAGIHHPQGKKAQAIKMLIGAPLRSSPPPEADEQRHAIRHLSKSSIQGTVSCCFSLSFCGLVISARTVFLTGNPHFREMLDLPVF